MSVVSAAGPFHGACEVYFAVSDALVDIVIAQVHGVITLSTS